jgi:4-amino-4-deoxy-L-arabinose transferase-like glycosyltransferase
MLQYIYRYPFLIPAIAVFVYLLAIPVDIMEIDSAQYACMARELIERNDFLHFYDRGVEYLDKPPLIFWITALFYKFFGINEFAFKMPSILFSIGGIYAVYRFTLLHYDRMTAALAAAILATTQGYFHFNNDVRTDSYLTNATIIAVWMLSAFLKNPRWYWWAGGFTMTGVAMLAKGPIGAMVPVLAFSTHFILTRTWRNFFRWQWLAGAGIVLLVLSPMLIGLYQQFDSHPEKWVNGRQAVSGVRFFFWEQSFGRLTGENVWKNDAGPFFFVHNLAWSFLPWTIPLFLALGALLLSPFGKSGFQLPQRNEWISAGGLILPFLALSTSHYKLPHYIYVVFPFAAVISADWLLQVYRKQESPLPIVFQIVVLAACWVFAGIIFIWFFPVTKPWLACIGIAGLLAFVVYSFKGMKHRTDRFILLSLVSVVPVNMLLALHFYPSILSYQAPGMMAKEFEEQGLDADRVYHLGVSGRSMDFYARNVIPEIRTEHIDSLLTLKGRIYIHTNEEGKRQLDQLNLRGKVKLVRDNYSVTLLTMNFGNPASRNKVTDKRYLIELP